MMFARDKKKMYRVGAQRDLGFRIGTESYALFAEIVLGFQIISRIWQQSMTHGAVARGIKTLLIKKKRLGKGQGSGFLGGYNDDQI